MIINIQVNILSQNLKNVHKYPRKCTTIIYEMSIHTKECVQENIKELS